eukprot:503024-Rhodomonas_salina.4
MQAPTRDPMRLPQCVNPHRKQNTAAVCFSAFNAERAASQYKVYGDCGQMQLIWRGTRCRRCRVRAGSQCAPPAACTPVCSPKSIPGRSVTSRFP